MIGVVGVGGCVFLAPTERTSKNDTFQHTRVVDKQQQKPARLSGRALAAGQAWVV